MNALVTVRPEPHRVLDEGGNARPYRQQLRIDDRVALEAAFEVADEVVAVGIGGDAAQRCVRSALERGADRGLHVSFDPIEQIVGEKYATVLARVVARESPDAVVVGEAASIAGSEVASFAASTLDWPSATRVTALGREHVDAEVDADVGELVLQRKLAVGRQEVVVTAPPVVLGIDSGFADPDRAPLDAAIDGRRADIETIDLADVAPGESRFSMSVGRTTLEQVTPNERWGRGRPPRTGSVEERIYRMLGRGSAQGEGAGERIDVPPEEAADRVVAFLEDRDLL